MTTAQGGETPVHRWGKEGLGNTHSTVGVTVAWAVRWLLVAQRVPSAALARAFPAEPAGSGRAWLRRVRRWWQGPALDQATLSPALLRLALTLLAGAQPVVVALAPPGAAPGKSGWRVSASRAARSPLDGRSSPLPGPRDASGSRHWPALSSASRPARPADAGRWSRPAAGQARGSLPRGARVARTSAGGCG